MSKINCDKLQGVIAKIKDQRSKIGVQFRALNRVDCNLDDAKKVKEVMWRLRRNVDIVMHERDLWVDLFSQLAEDKKYFHDNGLIDFENSLPESILITKKNRAIVEKMRADGLNRAIWLPALQAQELVPTVTVGYKVARLEPPLLPTETDSKLIMSEAARLRRMEPYVMFFASKPLAIEGVELTYEKAEMMCKQQEFDMFSLREYLIAQDRENVRSKGRTRWGNKEAWLLTGMKQDGFYYPLSSKWSIIRRRIEISKLVPVTGCHVRVAKIVPLSSLL